MSIDERSGSRNPEAGGAVSGQGRTDDRIGVSKRRIDGISGVRLVAALLVFASHSSTLLQQYGYGSDFMTSRGAWMFFVLSGFLYPASAISRLREIPSYIQKRAVRIYPLYLLVFGAMAGAAASGLFDTGYQLSVWNVLSNITLTQEWVSSGPWKSTLNPPTWSLSVEVFSWLVMPAAYLFYRSRRPDAGKAELWTGLGLWLLACAALVYVPIPRAIRDLPFFFIGIAVRHIVEISAPIRKTKTYSTVAMGLILSGGWALTSFEGNDVMFGYARLASAIGFALLVSCITNAASVGMLQSKLVTKIGGWSYSFFLLQTAMLSVYGRVVLSFDVPVAVAVVGVVGVCVATWLVAWFVYEWIEKPMTDRLTRKR